MSRAGIRKPRGAPELTWEVKEGFLMEVKLEMMPEEMSRK